MNAAIMAWVVSVLGAALFFAAGSLFTLRSQRAAREREHGDLERVRQERERLRAALAEAERERRALGDLAKERDRLRVAHAAVEKTARDAGARAEQAFREVAELAEQLRSKRKARASERPALPPGAGARGDVLRTILDRETRGNGYTGAVITDGLGLVVASTGEYGDALAAYGAFLAGVGAKTRDALPLHELRQVIVQDDHDTTLTVRPIAADEDNLALVTLAAGHGSGERAGARLEG